MMIASERLSRIKAPRAAARQTTITKDNTIFRKIKFGGFLPRSLNNNQIIPMGTRIKLDIEIIWAIDDKVMVKLS